MLAIRVRDGIDDIDFKIPALPELAKDGHVACTVMTKAMIVANEQLAHPEATTQNMIDEFFR
jgi:hypothetical protein